MQRCMCQAQANLRTKSFCARSRHYLGERERGRPPRVRNTPRPGLLRHRARWHQVKSRPEMRQGGRLGDRQARGSAAEDDSPRRQKHSSRLHNETARTRARRSRRAILPARALAECVCVQMGQARVLAACAVGSGEQDLNRWLAGPSPRSSHPVSHLGCQRACHDVRASYDAVGAHGGGAISPSSPPWRRPGPPGPHRPTCRGFAQGFV